MSNSTNNSHLPSDGSTVDLGSGQLVSMKAVQQIYSEITGRTESLECTYKVNHSAGFDDICQLDAKINQLQEQYHIASKNCSVTLFHLDDQKQSFSSFERFKLFDRTTLSPVENVRIEYNFLIILPQMRKPQSYKIEININSRAAMMKRASNHTGVRSAMFYEFLSPNTAYLEIEYVDYTVARNFQGAIDGWFRALPEVEAGRWLRPMKALAEHYVFIFRIALVATFLISCYSYFLPQLLEMTLNQAALFQASIITFGGMFLVSSIGGKLGGISAEAVRRVQCRSYVNLTRGDEIAFKNMSASNRNSWIKAAASFLLAICTKISATFVVSLLGISR